MYDCITLLYSRNWHNPVNQLYINNKIRKEKERERREGETKQCQGQVARVTFGEGRFV